MCLWKQVRDRIGNLLAGCEKLELNKLFGIIWQSNDPDFAQLLNMIQGSHPKSDDVIQIKA